MAFEFEVLTAELRSNYGIHNEKMWTVSIDKDRGWMLLKLPKHPQQYMYDDYACHFVVYYQEKLCMSLSLDLDVESKDGVTIYKWLNLHAFSGWGFIGEEAAIQIIKEALIAYGAGSSADNVKCYSVQCLF